MVNLYKNISVLCTCCRYCATMCYKGCGAPHLGIVTGERGNMGRSGAP
jgi:hypothetical protein